jgi:hypothetical protein
MSPWLPEGAIEWGGRRVARSVNELTPRCRAVLRGEVTGVWVRRSTPRRPALSRSFGVPGNPGTGAEGALLDLEASFEDGTGRVTLRFMGRQRVAGVEPGARLVVEGTVLAEPHHDRLVLLNPLYRLDAEDLGDGWPREPPGGWMDLIPRS